MVRYTLNSRILHTLEGRGYKLVCKICERLLIESPKHKDESDDEYVARIALLKDKIEIESKPSKYHHWECERCGLKFDYEPQKIMIGQKEVRKCPLCIGNVYSIGRKFYHAECYDNAHYGCAIEACSLITIKNLAEDFPEKEYIEKWLKEGISFIRIKTFLYRVK